MKKWMSAFVLATVVGAANAAVKEEPVTYRAGDTAMKGFVVYDDVVKGKRPGVVVVHEWWGITPHVRGEARKLAAQGYTAFVADLFGDAKTADNPDDAGALAGAVMQNPDVMRARFVAAKDALARHATVNADKLAAIGFCFGGSVVLDMARAGENLAGVVAFHAGLEPSGAQAAAGKTKARVLVLNGSADPFIKPESVDAFRKEMQAAGVDHRYVSYPGVVHAFTNPEATAKGRKFNLPLAYDAKADAQSKAEMRKFLAAALKN